MRLGHLLGLRRKFTVDGVRYREVKPSRESRPGRGSSARSYDVLFPDGTTTRIEADEYRRFADLHGPDVLDRYRPAERLLRPGMRIVIFESGTGAAAAWSSRLVGSAGAVVALDRDRQSIEYAQQRYHLPNVSYEVGGAEALSGETDGAFDAALAIGAFRQEDDAPAIIAELWRAMGDGGTVLLGSVLEGHGEGARSPRPMSAEQLATVLEAALSAGPPPEQVSIFRRGGYAYAVARRPAEE